MGPAHAFGGDCRDAPYGPPGAGFRSGGPILPSDAALGWELSHRLGYRHPVRVMPVLDDFAGCWQIARRIDDRRAGQVAVFAGTATLDCDGAGLSCCEAGLLQMPDQTPLEAARRHAWHQGKDDVIKVFFDDGRFFHAFDPRMTPCIAHHGCAPDEYRVIYDFSRWPVWQTIWQARGPRKDYTMASSYHPLSG